MPSATHKLIGSLAVTTLLTLLLATLPGCGCGFDCNNGNSNNRPALLTLGISDSLPEELKQVVIEVHEGKPAMQKVKKLLEQRGFHLTIEQPCDLLKHLHMVYATRVGAAVEETAAA